MFGEGGGAFFDAKIPLGTDPPRYIYKTDLCTHPQVIKANLFLFLPDLSLHIQHQHVMLRQLLGQTLRQNLQV